MNTDDLIAGLPGESLVRRGLADFQSSQATIPACLVGIARTRLSQARLSQARLNFNNANNVISPVEPELQLYRLLRDEKGDAYSRYNALLRELISFENALEQRLQRKFNNGK